MAKVDRYLEFMVKKGASDFHLSSQVRPMFRLNGKMVVTGSASTEPFSKEAVSELLNEILPARSRKEFESDRDGRGVSPHPQAQLGASDRQGLS